MFVYYCIKTTHNYFQTHTFNLHCIYLNVASHVVPFKVFKQKQFWCIKLFRRKMKLKLLTWNLPLQYNVKRLAIFQLTWSKSRKLVQFQWNIQFIDYCSLVLGLVVVVVCGRVCGMEVLTFPGVMSKLSSGRTVIGNVHSLARLLSATTADKTKHDVTLSVLK